MRLMDLQDTKLKFLVNFEAKKVTNEAKSHIIV